MDFAKILAQLREELKNVDAAIQTLERLQQSTRRRTRPGTESDLPHQEDLSPSPKNVSTSRKTRRGDPNQT